MDTNYEDRVRLPWWMIGLAPLVLLVAIPAPLVGWFGVPAPTAFTVSAVIAALHLTIALGTATSILVADGMLRVRSAITLGPLEVRLGRDRHLPLTAIRDVRLLRGAALKDVRRRLTSEPTRRPIYGDRIGFEPGSLHGDVPGRSYALHLAVIGADGRPQERLVYTRDADGFVGALGRPVPPPVLDEAPVPLPDGSIPPPDPLAAHHPRQRRQRGATGPGEEPGGRTEPGREPG